MTRSTDAIVDWIRAQAPQAQLTADSRRINPGDVFFAYPGDEVDGRLFIDDAIERGAAAVVHDDMHFVIDTSVTIPVLAVADLKQCAGAIANAWYQHPDSDIAVLAVTGTNGKTSCSQWLAAAWSRLSNPCAVIGTLGTGIVRNGVVEQLVDTGYTTPDAILLQQRLRVLRDGGAHALAIEASSIGIDQGRLRGLHIDTALWTNLSRDHLDYHGDMERYRAAKVQLFDWPGLQHAVINLDDTAGHNLMHQLQKSATTMTLIGFTCTGVKLSGIKLPSIKLLTASELRSTVAGTSFQLTVGSESMAVKTNMVGDFNVSNLLGVIGVLLAHGFALASIVAVIETLTAVPGRMQQFGGDNAPLVVIDYAHTPDALEKTLATLRPVAQQRSGKLWCVFGCGGDRDSGKRPAMGVAAMAADHIILTNDNPRSEDPADIITQILSGITSSRAAASSPSPSPSPSPLPSQAISAAVEPKVIEDRAAAILWAVRHAARPDVILLAGKGHETTQEVRGKKHRFLDADHAALALATRATSKGVHS